VDVGKPVVRSLRAGVAQLGRHAAVDDDAADHAACGEIPGHPAVSRSIQIVGYVVYAGCSRRGSDSKNAVNVTGGVRLYAGPGIDGIRLRSIADRVVDESCAVVIG